MECMNFGLFIESAAKRFPDKTAIVFEDREYKYKEFNSRADSVAAALLADGVGYGDRVGLLCHNCNEYIEVVVACAKIGAVCVQFNWRQSGREFSRLTNKSSLKCLFISSRFSGLYAAYSEADGAKPAIVSIGGDMPGAKPYDDLLAAAPPAGEWRAGGGEDILMQLFTSGTTGEQKGVLLSHRAIVTSSLAGIIDCGWREADVFVNVLPLFHTSSSGTYNSLICGATVVIHERFRVSPWLDSVQKYKGTRLSMTPSMIWSVIKKPGLEKCDMSSVKDIVYGAAPISLFILREAARIFSCKFYQLYGMTEMFPAIALLRPEHHNCFRLDGDYAQISSVGRPATGVILRIVDPAGNDLPPGAQGEIIARSGGMMTGYYDMPDETHKATRNGWYHTGDLGYFDEDGFLYVSGRASDIIISGEENISAREVEECIRMLKKDVADAAVFGVPDERWGESVRAAVVRLEGSTISQDEIIAHCRANMATYKCPRQVAFVDKLPRNDSGKIVKGKLRGC